MHQVGLLLSASLAPPHLFAHIHSMSRDAQNGVLAFEAYHK